MVDNKRKTSQIRHITHATHWYGFAIFICGICFAYVIQEVFPFYMPSSTVLISDD